MEHNYYSTFISVAEDSKTEIAKLPKPRGKNKTVAQLQYEMLVEQPHSFTQEQILFDIWRQRQGHIDLALDELEVLRDQFFGKGQPCLRTSPLAKTHGWGILFDEEGKAAAFPVESKEYDRFRSDSSLKQLQAMRSKRPK